VTQRIVPLVLLAFSGGYLWLASLIPLDPWSVDEPVGPRTLPIIYGSILTVFSVSMLFRGIKIEKPAYRWHPLVAMVSCIILFALLIPYAGLWFTVAGFLGTGLAILGERRVTVLLGAPAATAMLGWVLINVLLGVYIHPGYWWM
jgi:hypothetical protein